MRLEPCVVKVTSTVLRGGDGGNVVSLPDFGVSGQGETENYV